MNDWIVKSWESLRIWSFFCIQLGKLCCFGLEIALGRIHLIIYHCELSSAFWNTLFSFETNQHLKICSSHKDSEEAQLKLSQAFSITSAVSSCSSFANLTKTYESRSLSHSDWPIPVKVLFLFIILTSNDVICRRM